LQTEPRFDLHQHANLVIRFRGIIFHVARNRSRERSQPRRGRRAADNASQPTAARASSGVCT
jgi:hypothetical protein